MRNTKGVLGIVSKSGALASLLLVGALNAQELNCYADAPAGRGGSSPLLTDINVVVDKKNATATARWNGQTESSDLLVEEDNLAEFVFDGGAEAGIWETEEKDEVGAKKWAGIILPSEESGMYRLKCKAKNKPSIAQAQ